MCDVCDERKAEYEAERLTVTDRKGQPLVFLAVYETNLAYGGPEEGGWWYTEGELKHVEAWEADPVWDQLREDRIERLRADYPRDPLDGPPMSSMAYQGGAYEVVVVADGKVPVDHYPVVRPHYE